MSARALWTVEAMATAMGAERQGALPQTISGISIDSRTIAPGQAFFAIADRRDGHEFVASALAADAGACGRCRRSARAVPQRGAAARRGRRACGFARSRRRRPRPHAGQGDRRHRLGRQDRNQGGVAARARKGRRDPCLRRLLQQPVGRAVVARALSGQRALCGAGNGNESCRRDRAVVSSGASARCADHDDRAGASRILRLAHEDRRRQSRDFPRPRSRTAPPSSTAIFRNSRISSAGRRRRASRASSRSASTKRPTRASSSARCIRAARPSWRKFLAPNSPTRLARRAATSWPIRWRSWQRPCSSAPISRSRRSRSPNSSPFPAAARPSRSIFPADRRWSSTTATTPTRHPSMLRSRCSVRRR